MAEVSKHHHVLKNGTQPILAGRSRRARARARLNRAAGASEPLLGSPWALAPAAASTYPQCPQRKKKRSKRRKISTAAANLNFPDGCLDKREKLNLRLRRRIYCSWLPIIAYRVRFKSGRSGTTPSAGRLRRVPRWTGSSPRARARARSHRPRIRRAAARALGCR